MICLILYYYTLTSYVKIVDESASIDFFGHFYLILLANIFAISA